MIVSKKLKSKFLKIAKHLLTTSISFKSNIKHVRKIVSLLMLNKMPENNAVKSVVQYLQNLLCNFMKTSTKINFPLNQNSRKLENE